MARPKVVIVGGGFGGLAVARGLARADVAVTLVDRRNHHLFQPLLYQVATAALSPAQIAQPIRAVLRRQANAAVVLGEVVGIDRENRLVLTADAGPIPYDQLVLATGASHAYFGHEEWRPFAPGLKSLDDATAARRNILAAFERAEIATDEDERRALLTFAIVGGGPTGVEMAGAIAELARNTLAREFRHIDAASARVVLVEAGPRILPAMPPELSTKAEAGLKRLGVEVRLGAAVTLCAADRVEIGPDVLACRTIIWAAGVQASPVARWLGGDVAVDRAGRVRVEPDLTLPGDPSIRVIGDAAAVLSAEGRPVPGVAPAAKQQGAYVARDIAARLGAQAPSGPFRYRDQGNLATIGRGEAVVDLGRVRLSGTIAWWFWGIVHVFFLIDFRNRLSVSLDWIWSYLTYGRSARLMTEAPPRRRP
ncbi:NADH dehydrogenase [Stella humosa]|uniref:NADH dehydrogenase n=1 Tax=Stella humosa TaxID=94 RepID=A0A3N1KTF6_9PROT|nr:NAD(P)/FAD-dependent oxidoreductase [Stella humosa]ROP81386.1 NADH dehydrogenase [Stella humosa]BBK32737.1 NADH dehydrogenase [Stella humosa]